MAYTPHTEEDIRRMLEVIGLESQKDLFDTVPPQLRLQRPLDLPGPLSEAELLRRLGELSARNATPATHLSFLGGGAYNHFIPAVVDHLISRSEFYTAYTPYQPEISQGTLQAIFEFQTLICQLTGMEVANASMYDGASACAEAVLMAVRAGRKRHKILLSAAVHPQYRETVATYCRYLEVELQEISIDPSGRTDLRDLGEALDEETAAVVAGYPNYFGVIEPLEEIAQRTHFAGARLIAAVQEPIALGVLKSPGELGADIVIGEGQSFGLPPSFGGPSLGFFAALQKDMRLMPGRLVGETTDLEGRRGFVLTLATREQHIRREKATSNICSNQGLCALMAAIYLSSMGKEGMREVGEQNYAKATYAREKISALPGFSLPLEAPTFNEFVVEGPEDAKELLAALREEKILGGIPLARHYPSMTSRFLVCVTEQNSRKEIDALVSALGGRA